MNPAKIAQTVAAAVIAWAVIERLKTGSFPSLSLVAGNASATPTEGGAGDMMA